MENKSRIIFWIVLLIAGAIIFFIPNWDRTIINLIEINILFLIIRKPIVNFSHTLFRKRIYRIWISMIISIIWMIFIFSLIFVLSLDLFIALISFMVIAISLSFKKVITNVASGVLILASEQFEIGDLIGTNGIQGIVKEITLSYTMIREFDGVNVIIPNSNVYGSTLIKFTHKKIHPIEPPKTSASKGEKRRYRQYIKFMSKVLASEKSHTKYTKSVEFRSEIKPKDLDTQLSEVFDEYEEIFKIRPEYVIDTMRYGRARIILYIMADNPKLILNNTDAFIRDIMYRVYQDQIDEGWEVYKKGINKQPKQKAEVKK